MSIRLRPLPLFLFMLRLKYCNLNFLKNLPGFLLGILLGNKGLFESARIKNVLNSKDPSETPANIHHNK